MKKKFNYIETRYWENGKRIRIHEHRLVMQNHLGRKLRRDEYVHHINHDVRDNRIENLQIMTADEHNKLHWKGTYRNPNNSETHKQCPGCKQIFERTDPKGFKPANTYGRRGDGLTRTCVECIRATARKSTAKYRAKMKARGIKV